MRIRSLILFFCCFAALSAQESEIFSPLDSAVFNIRKQVQVFPQEKIYLQTDKPYYITGEKIFFRAHLIDALTHTPAPVSRYVYVELIDPVDSIVTRLKVLPEDEMYFGQFSLPEDMPEGVYKIRAYTNFMRNSGEDYFFSKMIRIGDPHALHVKTETSFTFEEDKKVVMELRFADIKMQEYLKPKTISVCINKGKTMAVKPDKEGVARIRFNLPHIARERVAYVELDDRRVYKQYIRIPYPEGHYDVSFYPEGGYLIADVLCNVAFKSLKSNGLYENITGEVYDSRGESVTIFSSAFQGMGAFIFTPKAGEQYYALCRNEKGVEMRFNLPEVRTDVPGLKINSSKDKCWVTVNRSSSHKNDTLYLLVHEKGEVQYAGRWNEKKEYLLFNKDDFTSGIVHFILLSSDLRPLSERLVFIWHEKDQVVTSFKTDKESYGKREKVSTLTELKDNSLQPVPGTFSITVTDDKDVKTDTCRNILESFLLSSELKGYIECPACYFSEGKRSQTSLDLLMMTQGWRRYDIPRVITGNLQFPKEPLEMGQVISGTVKGGLFSKASEKAKVSIIAPKRGYFDITEADKNGRFVFQGFEFPDSTQYIVYALSKKGGKRVELILDKESFPDHTSSWIYDTPKDDRIFQEYITNADMKYTYENGIRLINLEEVTVRASRRSEEKYQSSYYSMPDNSLKEEDIEKSGSTSVRNLLYRFPGVWVTPDKISIRGSRYEPLLMVDGVEMDIEMLDVLNVHDIGQIDLLKGASTAIFGLRGGNGVISIFTKRGEITFRDNPINIALQTPKGYHLPVEFYSPQYDTPEKISEQTPDLRSTIYWKPNVRVTESGEVPLDFYTADAETTYSVIMEGVAADGKIIRHVGKIKRVKN